MHSDKQLVHAGLVDHARHQADQLGEVAGAQRQFANLRAFDGGGTLRASEFDRHCALADLDRLGHRAHLHGHIDLQNVIGVQDDSGTCVDLEGARLHFNRVVSDRQEAGRVGSAVVGDDTAHHLVTVGVGYGDFGLRYGSAAGIQNSPLDHAGNTLGMQKRPGRKHP